MTFNGIAQILVFFAIIVATAVPLGIYMARVFSGERTFLSPILKPLETLLYRMGGVDEAREQSWAVYAVAMLLFNFVCFITLYAMFRLQAFLPFNPKAWQLFLSICR